MPEKEIRNLFMDACNNRIKKYNHNYDYFGRDTADRIYYCDMNHDYKMLLVKISNTFDVSKENADKVLADYALNDSSKSFIGKSGIMLNSHNFLKDLMYDSVKDLQLHYNSMYKDSADTNEKELKKK